MGKKKIERIEKIQNQNQRKVSPLYFEPTHYQLSDFQIQIQYIPLSLFILAMPYFYFEFPAYLFCCMTSKIS